MPLFVINVNDLIIIKNDNSAHDFNAILSDKRSILANPFSSTDNKNCI